MASEVSRKSVAVEDACDGFSLTPMDLTVTPGADGQYFLEIGGFAMRCAVGRNGLRARKREGDGCTPVGRWPLREVYYRRDKIPAPDTQLKLQAIEPEDGWCDAPGDANYNRPVKLPYPASHEEMWRADELYDVVVVVGYNDDPVEPGLGSAIFLHISRSDYAGTAGCVAVPLEDMVTLLPLLGPDSHLVVREA